MGQARQYSMQLRKTVFWCKYLSTFLKQTQPSCFAGTGGFQTTLSSLELSPWSVFVSGYKGMAWLISILLPLVAGGSAPWWLLGVSGRLSKLWLSRLHLKYSYQANLLRKDILQLAQHHIVPLLPARNSIQLGHTVIPNYSGKICDSEQQGMCNFITIWISMMTLIFMSAGGKMFFIGCVSAVESCRRCRHRASLWSVTVFVNLLCDQQKLTLSGIAISFTLAFLHRQKPIQVHTRWEYESYLPCCMGGCAEITCKQQVSGAAIKGDISSSDNLHLHTHNRSVRVLKHPQGVI